MSRRQNPAGLMAATVQLLIRKDRTRAELSQLLGVKAETAGSHLRLLQDEGLVRVVGKQKHGNFPQGSWSSVWRWIGVREVSAPNAEVSGEHAA